MPDHTGSELLRRFTDAPDSTALLRLLRDQIRMTDKEISRALGVRRVPARVHAPDAQAERLRDLVAVVVLLLQSGVLWPEEVGRWLRCRNAELGYARPFVLVGRDGFGSVSSAAERHIVQMEGRMRGAIMRPSRSSSREELQRLLGTANAGDDAGDGV